MRTESICLRRHPVPQLNPPPMEAWPVVYVGTVKGARNYALDRGYEWRQAPSLLFGGYYLERASGDCLMPDIA